MNSIKTRLRSILKLGIVASGLSFLIIPSAYPETGYDLCTSALLNQMDSLEWGRILPMTPLLTPKASIKNLNIENPSQPPSHFELQSIRVILEESYDLNNDFTLRPAVDKWLQSIGLKISYDDNAPSDAQLHIFSKATPTVTKYVDKNSHIKWFNWDLYIGGHGIIRAELSRPGQKNIVKSLDVSLNVNEVSSSASEKYKDPKNSGIWGEMSEKVSIVLTQTIVDLDSVTIPLLEKRIKNNRDIYALRGLARMSSPLAVEPLIAVIEDELGSFWRQPYSWGRPAVKIYPAAEAIKALRGKDNVRVVRKILALLKRPREEAGWMEARYRIREPEIAQIGELLAEASDDSLEREIIELSVNKGLREGAREAAILALGGHRRKKTLSTLIKIIRNEEEDEKIREVAIKSIGNYGLIAFPTLFVTAQDTYLKRAAHKILFEMGDKAIVPLRTIIEYEFNMARQRKAERERENFFTRILSDVVDHFEKRGFMYYSALYIFGNIVDNNYWHLKRPTTSSWFENRGEMYLKKHGEILSKNPIVIECR